MKPLPQTGDEAVAFPSNRSTAGFTLIEMIGALAILVILTAAVTPVAVRRVDIAVRIKEFSDLDAISNAIVRQIVRSNTIPCSTNWTTVVASWLNQPVANINTTPRKFQRLFLSDPSSSPSLPYSQSANGNLGWGSQPYDGRIIVVSSIARTNVPPTIDFNETWNWNNVLNPTAKPASWSTFPGNGDDVCIERINFQQFFYQLILVNRDQAPPGATNAPFNINGTMPPSIVTNLAYNGKVINDYYLAGTTLGLWSTNSSSSGTNALVTTYIINQNSSFVFENGTWNLQIQGCLGCTNAPPTGTNSSLATSYNQAAINFFNSLWNSGASTQGGKGATQTAVLSAFGNFMMDYSMWAEATSNGVAIPFYTAGSSGNLFPMSVILNAEQGNVDTYTGTGQGSNSGLLHE